MRVRAVDEYYGRFTIGETFTVAPRHESLFLSGRVYEPDVSSGAPLVCVTRESNGRNLEAYIWRFEVITERPYSPEQSGDTDEDI